MTSNEANFVFDVSKSNLCNAPMKEKVLGLIVRVFSGGQYFSQHDS